MKAEKKTNCMFTNPQIRSGALTGIVNNSACWEDVGIFHQREKGDIHHKLPGLEPARKPRTQLTGHVHLNTNQWE